MVERRIRKRTIFLVLYLVFAILPVYWMVNMSFKTNEEILSVFSLWPKALTWDNYKLIFTDASWYSGYINSMIYVAINTVISLLVALPAAYAFSRYQFIGDKHVFFWLLTNRMTPPAVFLLPFFQLYTTLGLMDTHIAVALAHLVFNVPLAVWILEGFMSGVPREIDETAYIDGYSFPRFFLTIFIPLIKAGVGVAAFFCFMFSWVELLMARTLTSVNAKPIVAVMTRTVSASGMDWGVLAAAGVLTNLLATAAAFGVAKLIFQEGHLSGLLGFEPQGFLDAWAPVFFFAMVFAISMDYTVFLLSSAKEHWDRTHDPKDAMIGAVAHSGRVVFAAAAVMVAVFFTFALSGPLPPKEMGVILGIAVLLDAALVRLLLVPVLLRLMGRWAWWLPKPLDRILPDVRFGHA